MSEMHSVCILSVLWSKAHNQCPWFV